MPTSDARWRGSHRSRPPGTAAARRYRLTRHLLVAVTLFGHAACAPAGQAPPDLPEIPPLKVGQEAPELSLPSLDGEARRLGDRRGVGPVVLVFFRGVW